MHVALDIDMIDAPCRHKRVAVRERERGKRGEKRREERERDREGKREREDGRDGVT